MKEPRLKSEHQYLVKANKLQMDFLRNHPEVLEDYLDFVKEEAGVPATKLIPRLRMVWSGRAPTALILATAEQYFKTGRHLGAVIEKVEGKTFIAPAEEMEGIKKLIFSLKCSKVIVGASLAKKFVGGWWLEVGIVGAGMGPDAGLLGMFEQLNRTANLQEEDQFSDIPNQISLANGARAIVQYVYTDEYDPLKLDPETFESESGDWGCYVSRAISYLDYAFRREKAENPTPGFMVCHMQSVEGLLVNGVGPYENIRPGPVPLSSHMDVMPGFLLYVREKLSPVLRTGFYSILDDLAKRYAKYRLRYIDDLAYADDGNAHLMDPLVRHDYILLQDQAANALAALVANHKTEVVALIQKAIADLPASAETKRIPHSDVREVGNVSPEWPRKNHLALPGGIPDLLVAAAADSEIRGYPELTELAQAVAACWKEAVPGAKPVETHIPCPRGTGRPISLGFKELLILSLVFEVTLKKSYHLAVTLTRDNKSFTFEVKPSCDPQEKWDRYLQGPPYDEEHEIIESIQKTGDLLWILRKTGKIAKLPRKSSQK